jgi:PhnB protein
MTAATPYLLLPGTARAALSFYQGVFGGDTSLNTYGDFGRDDGPADAIAHGALDGPVSLFAADAATGQETLVIRGLMFSLLGAAEAAVLRRWFAQLAERGLVVDDLQQRPWGASDGQVRDQFGILWLIGFESAE